MDMNRKSRLLQQVPDSEQGVCPESDAEGVNVDLSNGDDCVKIIANSENFTWNRRKQGGFAFMEQDFEDESPAVTDDEVTKYLTLDWVEGGCLPEPTDKMKDTSGGLRKGREKKLLVSCRLVHVYSSAFLLESVLWRKQQVCASVNGEGKGKRNDRKQYFWERSGKTLHWGSLWCSSASSFKCAYSHCQGNHMFCIACMVLS
jgi:hypothetical protein